MWGVDVEPHSQTELMNKTVWERGREKKARERERERRGHNLTVKRH